MGGEIRDAASTEAAWDAAATGKVLLSTLHSRDAAGVVTALRNYGRADFEIASMLDSALELVGSGQTSLAEVRSVGGIGS